MASARYPLLLQSMLLITLVGCSCFHRPDSCDSAVHGDKAALLLKNFETTFFVNQGKKRIVFRPHDRPHAPSAPAILLLHEMPALSAECLLLAERLTSTGYDVYVPLLFGSVNDSDRDKSGKVFLKNLIALEFSGHDWHPLFAEHAASGINDWLRALCREQIVGKDNHHRIGVIGMCLTGSFPLALMDVAQVRAAVVSQPALPLIACTREAKRSLGISKEELAFAVRRSSQEKFPILGFRFANDKISHVERFDELHKSFEDLFYDRTIPAAAYADDGLPDRAHSVLAGCYMKQSDRNRPPATFEAYKQLSFYLEKRLKTDPPNVDACPPKTELQKAIIFTP